MVVENKVIIEGRVQYVVLETYNPKIDILNIYAQNHTIARTQIWTKLSKYKFLQANWIVSGDFNMKGAQIT